MTIPFWWQITLLMVAEKSIPHLLLVPFLHPGGGK